MATQAQESILFALKDISIKPTTPRLKEPVTISGKIDLFRIPFIGPLWVLATITYPEKWWEKIIPIIGSPHVRETTIAVGGNFAITLPVGFDRDGDYSLKLGVYPGPTAALDSLVIPPAPAIASYDAKFTVSSEEVPGGEKQGTPSGLAITAYDSVSPPSVLQVKAGATLRVVSEFDYTGPATTGKFYTALWHPSWYDPHDEIAHGEKSFTLPDSPKGSHIKGYVDITVPSGFSGTDFGLYTKVSGAIKDAISLYYANIIEILAVAPPPGVPAADIADWDFKPAYGTYELGAKVPFTADFKYKGQAQDGQLTIYLGTGVAPTFSTVHTFSPVSQHFGQALDWAPGHIEGSITLPTTLTQGQTYSVRAKLETLKEPTQETDTDYGALAIVMAPPASDIGTLAGFAVARGTYNLGDAVSWSLPYEYKGKAQNGWLTLSLGTGAYPSFSAVYTFPRQSVTFEQAMDWTPFELSGSFILPASLTPGQTYSVRAKLETVDGAQETGTEYGAITIKEVAPPPPTQPVIKNLTIVTPTKSTWIGGAIYITVMFDYMGPDTTGQLYVAIGNKDTWFNEIWDSGWVTVALSEQTMLASATIPIDGGSPGTYDIYAKISVPGLADVFTPVYLDTIKITL